MQVTHLLEQGLEARFLDCHGLDGDTTRKSKHLHRVRSRTQSASFAAIAHLYGDGNYPPGKEKFMKVKLFVASLAVAGLAVSSAVAAPPEGKGKPKTGDGCKPKVTVVLKGTLTGAPLNVDVTSSNRWGRAYVPGTASTVIDFTGPEPVVIREGAGSADEAIARLRAALGL